jgi:hypothetical protein
MDDLKIGDHVEVSGWRRVDRILVDFLPADDVYVERVVVQHGDEDPFVVRRDRVYKYDDRPVPLSYRIQKCCENCMFEFEAWEHDGGVQYFCLHKAEHPRVPFRSVAMGEYNMFDYDEGIDWGPVERWYDRRSVDSWGICDEYKKRV